MEVNKTWKQLFTTLRYKKKLEEMQIKKKENEKKLFKACVKGNAVQVRRLIYDHMVDVNLVDKTEIHMSTPLIKAVRKGHNDIIRILLDEGADIESADNWGYRPISWAAITDRYETVKLLLDAGAKVDPEDKLGRNPLGHTNSKDVAKILLDHGADPNKSNEHYGTPLHRAVCYSNRALCKILIEAGADPYRKNRWGKTPLDEVGFTEDNVLAELLCNHN